MTLLDVLFTEISATGGDGADTDALSGAGRLGRLAIKDFAVGLAALDPHPG